MPLASHTIQTIDEIYASRPDLTDEPSENLGMEVFTNESSFRDGDSRRP